MKKRVFRIPQMLIIWGIICCCTTSCHHAGKPSQVYWKQPHAQFFKFYPIKWKNLVVIPSTTKEGKDCLKAVNIVTGIKEWELNDLVFSKIYYNMTTYTHEGLCVIPIGNEIICIKLATGKVLWRDTKKISGESHVYGKDGLFYRTYRSSKTQAAIIYEFDIKTGKNINSVSIPINNVETSIIRSPQVFKLGNTEYLAAPVIEYNPNISTESYLLVLNRQGLDLNYTEKLYDSQTSGKGTSVSPIIDESLSYWIADTTIFCYDLKTQKKTWSNTFPHGILTSRLYKYDEILLFPCENETLYALNTKTGNVIWTTALAGSPSKISVIAGIIHIIGGSNSTLYKIDIENGIILEKHKFHQSTANLTRTSLFNNEISIVTDQKYWYAFTKDYLDQVLEPVK